MKRRMKVAGTGRLDTILMEVAQGKLLAKLGADGVYCVSVMGEGIGIALKIESGESKNAFEKSFDQPYSLL